ncbi:hypothetical protein KKC32_03535 [Patescibacteria group bacterium]|nr:hypothetical protein [Patescibacteria group bacterium]
MRVIKVGRNNDDWKREFECPNCGAILEVERADLFIGYIGGIRLPEHVCFKCGECGANIAIDSLLLFNITGLPEKPECWNIVEAARK